MVGNVRTCDEFELLVFWFLQKANFCQCKMQEHTKTVKKFDKLQVRQAEKHSITRAILQVCFRYMCTCHTIPYVQVYTYAIQVYLFGRTLNTLVRVTINYIT